MSSEQVERQDDIVPYTSRLRARPCPAPSERQVIDLEDTSEDSSSSSSYSYSSFDVDSDDTYNDDDHDDDSDDTDNDDDHDDDDSSEPKVVSSRTRVSGSKTSLAIKADVVAETGGTSDSRANASQVHASGSKVPAKRAADDDKAPPSAFEQKRLTILRQRQLRSIHAPSITGGRDVTQPRQYQVDLPAFGRETVPEPTSSHTRHDASADPSSQSQPSSFREPLPQFSAWSAETVVPKPTRARTLQKEIAKRRLSSSDNVPSTSASASVHIPTNPPSRSKPNAISSTEPGHAQRSTLQQAAISPTESSQSVPIAPNIASVAAVAASGVASLTALQSKSQAVPDLSSPAHSAPAEPQAVELNPVQSVSAPVAPVPAPDPVQERSVAEQAPAQSAALPAFPPLSARSTEFWCWDGNVIVKVEETYFRLFMSRLERYCGLFKRVFAERSWAIVTGRKVVEVPNLKVQDFETFLKYLEIPMENSVKDASKDTAMSLLRASRVVSCRVLAKLAEQRLLGPWASADIPSPEDGLDGRPYREAIEMLGLSRELNAPLRQKQALYSLLANEQFWSDVASQRAEVALSDTDILLLYRARATIQEKWRILALTPPSQPCLLDVCLRDESARNALWWGQTAKYTKAEVRDPLRSAVNAKTAIREMGHWCRACLEERVRAWDNARNLWWTDLDQLLGIAV